MSRISPSWSTARQRYIRLPAIHHHLVEMPTIGCDAAVEFAADSPLEGARFEPSVPLWMQSYLSPGGALGPAEGGGRAKGPRNGSGLPKCTCPLSLGAEAQKFPRRRVDLRDISRDIVVAAEFAGDQIEAPARKGGCFRTPS